MQPTKQSPHGLGSDLRQLQARTMQPTEIRHHVPAKQPTGRPLYGTDLLQTQGQAILSADKSTPHYYGYGAGDTLVSVFTQQYSSVPCDGLASLASTWQDPKQIFEPTVQWNCTPPTSETLPY